MGGGCRFVAIAVIAAGALGFVLPAAAQDATSTQPGNGVPLGGFRLFPTLGLNGNYDSNVYRTPNLTSGDEFFEENPGFSLLSNWVRHELDLYGSLSAYQYASLTNENHNDWNLGGNGRLDIYNGVDFTGGSSYSILHEQRTSPDQPGNAKSPTQYAQTAANAVLDYHPYHFGFSVGGTYNRYDYDPTAIIGLPSFNNSDFNRDEYVGYAKGSYEFSPGYAMFTQLDYKDVGYDLTLDRNGERRANSGYSANVGLDMLVTDLVKGQMFVGYLDQNYHAPLVDISGFNFGANVDWNPTALWTVHLTASRTLNGTTLANASAEDDQTVRLSADYSFRSNIMIQAHIGYTDSVFDGISRDDQYIDAGLGMQYILSPTVIGQLAYDHQERSSTAAGQGFNDDMVTIGINYHL